MLAALPPGLGGWLLAALLILAAALYGLQRLTAARRTEGLRERLAPVLEAVPGGLAFCDTQGRLQLANSRFRRLFPRAEPGTPLGALLPAGMDEQGAFDHGLPDGSWHRVTWHAVTGQGYTLGSSDVTPLKRQEQALAARTARQQTVLDLAPVGIWELDGELRTVFANPQMAVLMGGSVPAGLREAGLRRPSAPGRPTAQPLASLPLPQAPMEVEHERGGITRRLLLMASDPLAVAGAAAEAVRRTRLVTVLDITERQLAQAEMERLAWHDPVTGLGNHARFTAALEARLPAGVTLLAISLTGLAQVNERHGRTVGDAVLRAAALRLSQALRGDDAVFRTGGNKFAILAPAMDQPTTRWLCERLSHVLVEGFRHGALGMALPPAIGVASTPQIRGGAETLRRAAELALRRSETEARAPIFYEDWLGTAAERRQQLREALSHAIPGRELRLLWQPLLDTRANRLVGAEALLRWESSVLGRQVMPAELFPVATEIGMLAEIDYWVLWESLTTKRRWAGRPGAPEVIAINISAGTLRDPGFPAQVHAALDRYDVAPRELEIEIPEDIPARDLPALARNLEALRSLGVRLSLDDFGGGVSAMAHLVQLPAGRVKLDRSIIRGLPEGGRESAVLGAVATLVRSLGIEMVAEGVETEAQAAALRAEGCFVMQGWLYGRPLPADQLVPPEA